MKVTVEFQVGPIPTVKLEALLMSLLASLNALNQKADAAIARVDADVKHLRDEVARLQAKVDAGVILTEEEKALLEELAGKLDKLDPDPSFPAPEPTPEA